MVEVESTRDALKCPELFYFLPPTQRPTLRPAARTARTSARYPQQLTLSRTACSVTRANVRGGVASFAFFRQRALTDTLHMQETGVQLTHALPTRMYQVLCPSNS